MYRTFSSVCVKSSHRLISHGLIPVTVTVTHLERPPEKLTHTGLYHQRAVLGSDTGLLRQGRSWQNSETQGDSADLTLDISSIGCHIQAGHSTLFICQGRETETMERSYFVHKSKVKFIQVVPTHSSDFKGNLRFRN